VLAVGNRPMSSDSRAACMPLPSRCRSSTRKGPATTGRPDPPGTKHEGRKGPGRSPACTSSSNPSDLLHVFAAEPTRR
jgi:hypothetical protein